MLARQLTRINTVPTPAAPLNVRPLLTPVPSNDALRQVNVMARQLAQIKTLPAPAAPLDVRPLVPPAAPNNDALRQVSRLASQLAQLGAGMTLMMGLPHQL